MNRVGHEFVTFKMIRTDARPARKLHPLRVLFSSRSHVPMLYSMAHERLGFFICTFLCKAFPEATVQLRTRVKQLLLNLQPFLPLKDLSVIALFKFEIIID